jgi:hypothetical protein
MCHALRLTFALAMMLTGSISAGAQTYLGSGGTSCREYMSYVSTQTPVAQGMELWALGYVSGLNMASYATIKIDRLIKEKSNAIVGFARGYCSANPEKTLSNALNEYWFQLARR